MIVHAPSKKKAKAPVLDSRGVTSEGRERIVLEKLSPEVDGGRFAIKRASLRP